MEKVKLPREVADAIDSISRMQNWKMRIMECMFDDQRSLSSEMATVKTFFHNNGTNGELIMQALVNGYEVEQTPEDKVRELFRVEGERDNNGSPHASWILTGALRVLEAYNIKIEGVNS